MKQKHTLTYFTNSLVLFLFCVTIQAQNDSIATKASDSIIIKEKYGLRIGGDLSKLVRSFAEDDYTGFQIEADYRLKKRLYLAAEIGFDNKTSTTDYLDITTQGSYLKAGIDYNLYDNWLDMDNMIYGGFRLGVSSFSHELNSFTVYNTNQYWAPQYSSDTLQEFNDLSAVWIEGILGMKAQILNNLYLGLNVQLKILVSETEPDNFQSIYVPGYNKTNDSSKFGAGFGYSLSYRIPLYQKNK
ncbi:DUF6048 family protein [Algibacter miyuki]|uniref:DUF6048 family protein n=1 Tax=Algibacter miyuki TaxID=1306933 RepID=A0ABV5H0R2_9FLAO|nr:DUF6048 family protein [Algibacter miyuki]MDN3664126.1 DUF6048 family protein [Algibacter miyuki]